MVEFLILAHHYVECFKLSAFCLLQGASAVPKRNVRALESSDSLSIGGLDGLPREDISGKITPALLKGLESPDWKV